MTGYRRNFVAGGSFFFTVNLMERRLGLLTQHIDELRSAFRETRRHHPFTSMR
jgi:putative transposase